MYQPVPPSTAMESMLSLVGSLDDSKTRLMECITGNTGERSRHRVESLVMQQTPAKDLLDRASLIANELSKTIDELCDEIKNSKTRGIKMPAVKLEQLKLLASSESYSASDILREITKSGLVHGDAMTIVFGDGTEGCEDREVTVEVSHVPNGVEDIIGVGSVDGVVDGVERVVIEEGVPLSEGGENFIEQQQFEIVEMLNTNAEEEEEEEEDSSNKVKRRQIRPNLSVKNKVISYNNDDLDELLEACGGDEDDLEDIEEDGDTKTLEVSDIKEVKGGVGKVHGYLQFPVKRSKRKAKKKYAYLDRPLQCQHCGMVMRKAQMGRHMAGHFKRFQCDLCPKMFYWKSEIERHRRTHTKDKKYACKLCDMVYTAPSSLHAHVKNHHKNERSFVCCTCGLQFNERYRMENHISIVHDQHRPYACHLCGKTCANKTNLGYHMKVHGLSPKAVRNTLTNNT